MARKTNKELRVMSINELERYAVEHPAESGRVSRILASSAGKYLKYL